MCGGMYQRYLLYPKQQLNIGTMLRQCSYVVGMLNVGYECCNNIEPILSSNWNIDSMLCEHYIVLCEILNVVCTLCQCCNLTYLRVMLAHCCDNIWNFNVYI